jgi:hypothetical protein
VIIARLLLEYMSKHTLALVMSPSEPSAACVTCAVNVTFVVVADAEPVEKNSWFVTATVASSFVRVNVFESDDDAYVVSPAKLADTGVHVPGARSNCADVTVATPLAFVDADAVMSLAGDGVHTSLKLMVLPLTATPGAPPVTSFNVAEKLAVSLYCALVSPVYARLVDRNATAVVALADSSPGWGSVVVEVTDAVLVSDAGPGGPTVAWIRTTLDPPAANVPKLNGDTHDDENVEQPVPVQYFAPVNCAGNVSANDTDCASDGPLFVTVIV